MDFKLKKKITALSIWLSIILPVFLFEEYFRSQFEAHELTGGVYRDAPMVYVTISVLLTVIYLWFTPRWFPKKAYKIAIVLIYSFFFTQMCTQVAWDYRINFGTTWQWSEVFFELVATKWVFYVFGVISLLIHYWLQKVFWNKF